MQVLPGQCLSSACVLNITKCDTALLACCLLGGKYWLLACCLLGGKYWLLACFLLGGKYWLLAPGIIAHSCLHPQ